MTVIAWDGKTLAADKQATSAGLVRTVTKIFRHMEFDDMNRPVHWLLAISGDLAKGLEMVEWFRAGRVKADLPSFQRTSDFVPFLAFSRDKILRFDDSHMPIPFEDKFFAGGTGRDFALATLHLGFGARRAVEVACEFETNCGMGIDTMELPA